MRRKALAALLIVAAAGLVLFLVRDSPPGADPDGYLRMACGLHAESSHVSSVDDHPDLALIALERRLLDLLAEEDPGHARLGEVAERMRHHAAEGDTAGLTDDQEQVDRECSDVDAFEPDPDTYVDVACTLVRRVVDSDEEASGSRVDTATELVAFAVDHDSDYEALERGARKLREGDPDDGPEGWREETLKEFLDECPQGWPL